MSSDKPIYFKGLNGIRAIASLLVVIWHTDRFVSLFGVIPKGFYNTGMASRAVDIFFVLSGFLITYLLFAEKEKTGTINFKKFYLRRVYRIWPIYYIITFLTLILMHFEIIPKVNYALESTVLYIFMLANVAYALKIAITSINPLWSIGVEEQFYLIWPHIIKRASNYLKVFIWFYLAVLIVKIVCFKLFSVKMPSLVSFFYHWRLNIMALGAMGAYLVFNKKKILSLVYRKEIQLLAWGILLYSCLVKPIHFYTIIDSEINSIFYLIIILNVATNSKTLISLENKVFNFIGQISYGIYIYHLTVIYVLVYLFKGVGINYFLVHILTLLITIVVAKLSYRYIEIPFLKIKKKFAVVESSNVKQ
ncbi:acyltransferase family protein [Pseudofulvibacter geojedonensis]|uniref:Acyltransferase family protein n=1 Tax=Pseudofulvibacter geojedonensis TaxID=1123758 RepID=A0ABW3HYH5_9FLAO